MRQLNKVYVIGFFLVILSALAFFVSKQTNVGEVVRTLQKNIHIYEDKMDDVLAFVQTAYLSEEKNEQESFIDAFSGIDNTLNVLVYKNDSLIFWSDNKFPDTDLDLNSCSNNNVILSGNGWYLTECVVFEEWTFFTSLLIKNEFPYENEFLSNSFNEKFKLFGVKSHLSLEEGDYNIYCSKGSFLFSVSIYEPIPLSKGKQNVLFAIFALGMLLLSVLITIVLDVFIIQKYLRLILFALIVVVFRLASFYYSCPSFIYNLDIFSSHYFAASYWLPSLGDLIINVLLFLVLSCYIVSSINIEKISLRGTYHRYFVLFIFGLSSVFLYKFSFSVLKSLIFNSNIYLLFNNYYETTVHSFLAIILIGILLYVFHIFTYKFIELAVKHIKTFWYFIIFLVFLSLFLYSENGFLILTFVLYNLTLWFFLKNKNVSKTRLFFVCLCILMSMCTLMIYKNTDVKEKERRKLLAFNLASDKDPLAEFLFIDIQSDIYNDTVLINDLHNYYDNEQKITEHILSNYFYGYWAKYEIQITICDADDRLLYKPEDVEMYCSDLFKNMINAFGKPTGSPYFFQLHYLSGRNAYLADLPFYFKDRNSYVTIYIELLSKFVPKQLGYPELLIDKNIRVNTTLLNYNYAKYRNDELFQQYGNYFYFTDSRMYQRDGLGMWLFDQNNFSHLYYKVDDSLDIIISKEKPIIMDYLASFSYLFILICCVWILIILSNKPGTISVFFRLNFSDRIKFSMIAIVLVSFVAIGIITTRYIIGIYENKNYDYLNEKAHSVLIEFESKLAHEPVITADMHNYIRALLVKFSGVFFTDINMYDIYGNLIASSREKIFYEALISQKMNTKAYINLTFNQRTFFAHSEKIGKLDYLSAYMPFHNFNNECIAYINLPYFAKQSEQQQEMSSFLAAFVNIYVLLIGFSIILALLLSKYVTQPLIMIKEKLSVFKLGKVNEKITWQRNDEIGSLVNEYNRLIDELQESAEVLSRSEREHAWREMAKQVAHEIKNPLTPMKLSVQHLKKTWDDNHEEFSERLHKFVLMMIDQIDTLSDIASSFSDFAKMPVPKNEKIDLKEIVSDVLGVYENIVNVKLFNKTDMSQAYFVEGDKKQLKRALNNLVKNALQATEPVLHGCVDVLVYKGVDNCIISIKDNGNGIPEELKEKIFLPNFTTKSSGMGLGLAIVKNIVEGFKGKVYYKSQEGRGTAFYIELPLLHDK